MIHSWPLDNLVCPSHRSSKTDHQPDNQSTNNAPDGANGPADFMVLMQGALKTHVKSKPSSHTDQSDEHGCSAQHSDAHADKQTDMDKLEADLAKQVQKLEDQGVDVKAWGDDLLNNLKQIENLLTGILPQMPPEFHDAISNALDGLKQFEALVTSYTNPAPTDGTLTTDMPTETDPELPEQPDLAQSKPSQPSENLSEDLTTDVPPTDTPSSQPELTLAKLLTGSLPTPPSQNDNKSPAPIPLKPGTLLENLLEKLEHPRKAPVPAVPENPVNQPAPSPEQTRLVIQLRGLLQKAFEGSDKPAEPQADWIANMPPKAQEALQTALDKIQNLPNAGQAAKDFVDSILNQTPDIAHTPRNHADKSISQLVIQVSIEEEDKPEQPDFTSDIPLPDTPSTDPNTNSIDSLLSSHAVGDSHKVPENGVSNLQQTAPNAPPQQAESPQSQVVDALKSAYQAGRNALTLNLRPDSLGSIRMTLTQGANSEVTLRMVADNSNTREMLENTVHQLIQSLEDSGLKIGRISVTQAEGGQSFNDSNGFTQQQQHHSQNEHQHNQAAWQSTFGNSSSYRQSSPDSAQPDTESAQESTDISPTDGDTTSSNYAFDTDVEGEEVQTGTGTDKRVDIRV